MGRRAYEITQQRIRDNNILSEHLPRWRLRFAIALGAFPVLWVLPRCRECRKPWPCRHLTACLRRRHGWTGSIVGHVKNLSTKRRRARAAKRSPTAVSHREKPRRRPGYAVG